MKITKKIHGPTSTDPVIAAANRVLAEPSSPIEGALQALRTAKVVIESYGSSSQEQFTPNWSKEQVEAVCALFEAKGIQPNDGPPAPAGPALGTVAAMLREFRGDDSGAGGCWLNAWEAGATLAFLESVPPPPTMPQVNNNGNTATALRDNYLKAHQAVGLALQEIGAQAPHGRDYLPQGGASYRAARREHESRLERMREILHELDALVQSCHRQTREGRKAS